MKTFAVEMVRRATLFVLAEALACVRGVLR